MVQSPPPRIHVPGAQETSAVHMPTFRRELFREPDAVIRVAKVAIKRMRRGMMGAARDFHARNATRREMCLGCFNEHATCTRSARGVRHGNGGDPPDGGRPVRHRRFVQAGKSNNFLSDIRDQDSGRGVVGHYRREPGPERRRLGRIAERGECRDESRGIVRRAVANGG